MLKPGGWVIFGTKAAVVVGNGKYFVNKDNKRITATMKLAGDAF